MSTVRRFVEGVAPGVGYGLTVFATLYLGNVGLILATFAGADAATFGRLAHIVAFSIVGSLAVIFTGLNIARRRPLPDRSAMLWIWLLGLLASRRAAVIALSVHWDQEMVAEAALLAAAAAIVLMGSAKLTPERSR